LSRDGTGRELYEISDQHLLPFLKDERPTSNIEHPTSNEKQISNTEHTTAISIFSSFPIQNSMFDVGCSMFIFFFPPAPSSM